MPRIDSEFIARFSEIQPTIWEIGSQTVASAFKAEVALQSPLVLAASPDDLATDLSGAQLTIQWCFEGQPSEPHMLIIGSDLAKSLIGLASQQAADTMSPELLEPHRGVFESFVHAIVDGSVMFQPLVIAQDSLVIQYEIFALPPELAHSEEVLRVQLGVTGSDLTGSVTWVLSEASARSFLGEAASARGGDDETGFSRTVSKEEKDIEILMDIPLQVTVELGRVSMLVQDILELGSGSIVELEKAAGEPVDVLVNGRLVARGEVVVVEDNFGVRLTEILSPQDRLGRLGEAA